MAQIEADYLGGEPSQPEPIKGGTLAAAGGSLTFLFTVLENPIKPRQVEFTLPKEEIRALSVGDANYMKTLTRTAVGAAIGGSVGALIGAATGGRNFVFMVAGQRDGFEYVATFAVRGDDGTHFLNAIQSGRRQRGENLLPRVEELADLEALDVSQEQLRLLGDIRSLLIEQNILLARLLAEGADESPGVRGHL